MVSFAGGRIPPRGTPSDAAAGRTPTRGLPSFDTVREVWQPANIRSAQTVGESSRNSPSSQARDARAILSNWSNQLANNEKVRRAVERSKVWQQAIERSKAWQQAGPGGSTTQGGRDSLTSQMSSEGSGAGSPGFISSIGGVSGTPAPGSPVSAQWMSQRPTTDPSSVSARNLYNVPNRDKFMDPSSTSQIHVFSTSSATRPVGSTSPMGSSPVVESSQPRESQHAAVFPGANTQPQGNWQPRSTLIGVDGQGDYRSPEFQETVAQARRLRQYEWY